MINRLRQDLPKLDKLPITAIILTLNEESNIKQCLESIEGICDQIIVVDSGSTDRTIEICKHFTKDIETHPYVDHVTQWKWALTHLDLKHEWIMPLDADHIVSPELQKDIANGFAHRQEGTNGFYSRHKIIFMGKPLRGFKEYSLRLFNLRYARMDASEMVDFRFIIEGRTQKLDGILYEDNKKEASIDFWIDKHQKFSTRMAIEELLRKEKRVKWSIIPNIFGNQDQRIVWFKNIWYSLPLFIRPFLYFFYRYFIRLGILDGKTGLIYHFLQAFWFRFITDVKIYMLKKHLEAGIISLNTLIEVHGHVQDPINLSVE